MLAETKRKEIQMTTQNRKAIVLEMIFGKTDLYGRFIQEIGDNTAVEKNFIRGRVAADGAWLTLEIRGPSRGIDEIVRKWRDWILAFTALPRSVA
jgi:hypothetical protein